MIDRLKEYINSRIALFRLEIIEKTSKGITFLVLFLILGTLFMFFLLFFSVAIALLLGKAMGQWWYGFGIVALFYFLLFIIILAIRGPYIERPLLNKSVNYLFARKDEENEEE